MKYLFIILVLFILVVAYHVNHSGSITAGNGDEVRLLNKDKPSVYIVYDQALDTERFLSCAAKKTTLYRFRLYNNTNKPLALSGSVYGDSSNSTYTTKSRSVDNMVALNEGKEIQQCFQSEGETVGTSADPLNFRPEKNKPPHISYLCDCEAEEKVKPDSRKAPIWLMPGTYVIFPVPKEYIYKGVKFYTVFNYEWEFNEGQRRENEPVHKVYFYGSDLPRSSLPSSSG